MTIKTPETFGNINPNKIGIETINNKEHYVMYDGKVFVAVQSAKFDEDQLKNADKKVVKDFQQNYLGENPKTREDLGKQLYHSLERSRLDMAGEIFGNKEIYSKDNFIKNYKALQRTYTYANYDERKYRFENIDDIIKPTENGWFFKAFHTYNQTTDELHYIDRTYVFLPESVVDRMIEKNFVGVDN